MAGIVNASSRTSFPAAEHGAGAVGSLLPGSWVLPGELRGGHAFSTSLKTLGEDMSGGVVSCSKACIKASAAALGLRTGPSGGPERPLVFLQRRAGRDRGEAGCTSSRSSSFPEAASKDVLADLKGSGTVPMEFFRKTSALSPELSPSGKAVSAQSEDSVRDDSSEGSICSGPVLPGAAGRLPALWRGFPVACPKQRFSAPHGGLRRALERRPF